MLYTPVKVTAAEDQLEKLKYPGSLDKPFLSIKIRFKGKKSEDEHTLLLTRGQIDSINWARSAGKRTVKTLGLSKNQIKKNISHQGGFLSFLAILASQKSPCRRFHVWGSRPSIGKEW